MLLPALVGVLFVFGCGSTHDLKLDPGATGGPGSGGGGGAGAAGGGGGAGATGGGGGTGGSTPGAKSFTVTFDPVKVAPGTERTQCVTKRLGNEEIARVHEIHNVLPTGSHHLIVYRTADTEEKLTPYDCQPFADTLDPTKGSPVMITQKHEDTLTLPPGVAFTMQPGTMVRLEMHYLNPTFENLDISATSTFFTMPEAEYKDEADFLFIGNPDVKIAPHSTATLGPTFLKLPDQLAGVNFFGITGHTHQWGKDVSVNVTPSKAEVGTPVYKVPDYVWSEPPTVYHDPPFQIPAGGGFKFTCSWDNQSPSEVGFGESANDEMCFFWAYYYPSKGSLVCAHTDQVPGGYDLCCPGNNFCSQIF
jgi:hypothetical protein